MTLARVIEELRQPAEVWLAPVNRSALALLEGDYEDAEASIAQRSQVDSTGSRPGATSCPAARMHGFLLRREQGRVGEEETAVREAIVDFPWYPMFRSVLVCLLLDLGEVAESRAEFEQLAAGEFAALYRDNSWLFGISLAAEACARLGDASAAKVLLEQLAPFAGRHAIAHAEGSVGAVDRYLGLLARDRRSPGRGRTLSAGGHHLQRADGSPTVGRSLSARSRRGPPQARASRGCRRGERARPSGPRDRTCAGYGPRPRDRNTGGIARRSARSAGCRVGRLPSRGGVLDDRVRTRRVPGPRFAWHAAPGPAAPGARYWRSTRWSWRRRPRRPSTVGRSWSQTSRWSGSDGAGPTLDAEAKAAYRARLVDLREELAEAEDWHDPERIARLEAEQDALAHELGAALGIGGRDRPSGSPSERARISATRAIRAAMAPHRRAEPGARCPSRSDHQDGHVLRVCPGPARAGRVAALTDASAGGRRGSSARRPATARPPRSTAGRSSS